MWVMGSTDGGLTCTTNTFNSDDGLEVVVTAMGFRIEEVEGSDSDSFEEEE